MRIEGALAHGLSRTGPLVYERARPLRKMLKSVDPSLPGLHWEFGPGAFFDFTNLGDSFQITDLVPLPLFGFPLEENKNLPEYAIVLCDEGKETDSMEKETRTYCVAAGMETHEYVATGYIVNDGHLTIYNEKSNIATYVPLSWRAIWEKGSRSTA